MNFPRYQFADENETELLEFLKVSKEQKLLERNVDLNNYQLWKDLLPPDPKLLEKLHNYGKVISAEATVILSSDDEHGDTQLLKENDNKETTSEKDDNSALSDIAFEIKENLETQNELSNSAKEHLLKVSNTDLNILLSMLGSTLCTEEIYYMGISLQNIMIYNNSLVTAFCHNLLVPQLRKEYSDKILHLIKDLTIEHPSMLGEEFLTLLQETNDQEIAVVLQYIKKLDTNFQSTLVRDFILSIRRLNKEYLLIIESLVSVEVECEALTKLTEMLSNIADEHTRDKNFGNLLMKVIEALGPNLIHFEQTLKHIIAGHKSAWKPKLEKTFKSRKYSQSFLD